MNIPILQYSSLSKPTFMNDSRYTDSKEQRSKYLMLAQVEFWVWKGQLKRGIGFP